MAFTGTDWNRRVLLTGLTPGSSLSGYVALITLDNIPVEMVDAGTESALNGGGDIRISTDSAGVNQLPLEVVSFVTNATEGSRACELWVRFPTYASGTRECYLFYGKAGETQPAVTDTFGRNNVWQDYSLAMHGTYNLNDSTGNWTSNVTAGSVTTDPDLGASVSNANRLEFDSSTMPSSVSVVADVNCTTFDNNLFGSSSSDGFVVFSTRLNSSSYSPTLYYSDNSFGGRGFIADRSALARGAADGDTTQTATFTETLKGTFLSDSGISNYYGEWRIYSNGVQAAFNSGASTGNYNGNAWRSNIYVGHHPEWGVYADLSIKWLHVKESADSADYTETEYDNRSSASTFWTTGTPENTGGGSTVNVSPNVSTLDIDDLNPSITFELQVNNTLSTIDIDDLNPTITIEAAGEVNVNPTVSTIDIDDLNPIISFELNVSPNVSIIDINDLNPSISFGSLVNVSPNVSTVEITDLNPNYHF